MNENFKALLKFTILLVLAILGETIIRSVSLSGTDNYYSMAVLIFTILIFVLFGFILGAKDLTQYITSRMRVRVNYLKLSLGLACLTIYLTIGILALFEPGNNFAPNGVYEFFLKSPVFSPLFLITCGLMLATSVEKYEGMF
jgi:membrane protease YdiL (CAAX protease family)